MSILVWDRSCDRKTEREAVIGVEPCPQAGRQRKVTFSAPCQAGRGREREGYTISFTFALSKERADGTLFFSALGRSTT